MNKLAFASRIKRDEEKPEHYHLMVYLNFFSLRLLHLCFLCVKIPFLILLPKAILLILFVFVCDLCVFVVKKI